MVKLSELLFKVKQLEHNILRKIELRNEIYRKDFVLKGWEKEKLSADKIKKLDADFIKNQKEKILDVTKNIELIKGNLFDIKTKINNLNVEKGIDIKLLKVKWMRIELAKLMELSKSHSYLTDQTSFEKMDELAITDKILDLENKKQKLDSEIQNMNINTVVGS